MAIPYLPPELWQSFVKKCEKPIILKLRLVNATVRAIAEDELVKSYQVEVSLIVRIESRGRGCRMGFNNVKYTSKKLSKTNGYELRFYPAELKRAHSNDTFCPLDKVPTLCDYIACVIDRRCDEGVPLRLSLEEGTHTVPTKHGIKNLVVSTCKVPGVVKSIDFTTWGWLGPGYPARSYFADAQELVVDGKDMVHIQSCNPEVEVTGVALRNGDGMEMMGMRTRANFAGMAWLGCFRRILGTLCSFFREKLYLTFVYSIKQFQ